MANPYSTTLSMISVQSGPTFTPMAYTPNVHFAYAAPPVTNGFANTKSSYQSQKAINNQIKTVVDYHGAASNITQYNLKSFAAIDGIMQANPNLTADHAYLNATLMAGQQKLSPDAWYTPWLSGGPFSPVKALVNYIWGNGRNLNINIQNIGINVGANNVPSLRYILSNNVPSGIYKFSDPAFGYQTYKDSYTAGAYIGGFVLKAYGSVTINDDRTYSYTMNVSAAMPDRYDADKKRAGRASSLRGVVDKSALGNGRKRIQH